ncbi:MAG: hypothetical protein LUG21_00680 [Clostridiales bacterium]|nr:hypothetical protein [Clostridiales bacterium]
MIKNNYNKLIIAICTALVSFLIIIRISIYKMFNINMISPTDFKYWSSFKIIAITFSTSFIVLLLLLIITIICRHNKFKAKKALVISVILVILTAVIFSIIFGFNVNKSSFSEHIQNRNMLPANLCDLNYFDDLNTSYDIQTVKNKDAELNIVILKNGSKELSYYELKTSNSLLFYIFEINLLGISTSITHDAINPECKIEGLDYYIYETDLYYSYDQIPSHSQSEIFAKVNKTPDYSLNDFESDILKIREH